MGLPINNVIENGSNVVEDESGNIKCVLNVQDFELVHAVVSLGHIPYGYLEFVVLCASWRKTVAQLIVGFSAHKYTIGRCILSLKTRLSKST